MINWSTKDIAGIEFGDRHIAVVRVREKAKGALVMTHAGTVDYDSSAAPKVISEAVRQLWKQARVPTRTVCASLRSGSQALRFFNLPPMTVPELKRSLQLKAEEALQIPGSDVVVEWHLNPTRPGEGVKAMSGLLAAAPVSDVERELEVLYAAGLDPVILDVRPLAVANLFEVMGESGMDRALCLVNLSQHAADVMIRRPSGELYPHAIYCRASTWEEAPGFLAENIRDVIRYSEYKLGWESVTQVVFTGAIPGKEGFLAMLKEALKVEVRCWSPVTAVARKSRAVAAFLAEDPARAGLLTAALGLALRRS